MGQYQSDRDMIARINGLDDGVCNPIRIGVNDEIRDDYREQLRGRGWTDEEIDAEVK